MAFIGFIKVKIQVFAKIIVLYLQKKSQQLNKPHKIVKILSQL